MNRENSRRALRQVRHLIGALEDEAWEDNKAEQVLPAFGHMMAFLGCVHHFPTITVGHDDCIRAEWGCFAPKRAEVEFFEDGSWSAMAFNNGVYRRCSGDALYKGDPLTFFRHFGVSDVCGDPDEGGDGHGRLAGGIPALSGGEDVN